MEKKLKSKKAKTQNHSCQWECMKKIKKKQESRKFILNANLNLLEINGLK